MEFIKKITSMLDSLECSTDKYEEDFAVRYTFDSTNIEGNKLSFEEVKELIFSKKLKKDSTLIDLFEVVNHLKAYQMVIDYAKNNIDISEEIVKDIHSQLMNNIIPGGFYRNHSVRIKGSTHKPPVGREMHFQIKNFFSTLKEEEQKRKSIEKAAYTHAEFVRIHPFEDGNGRTARLLMNYQLLKEGYLPITIPKEMEKKYFNCLEEYEFNDDLKPFVRLISKLEIQEFKKACSLKEEKPKLKKKKRGNI